MHESVSTSDSARRRLGRRTVLGAGAAILCWAGACGLSVEDRSAHPLLICSGGDCDCVPGLGECDGNLETVCETDVLTHPDHCGECGEVCTHGTCEAGSCKCTEGFGNCDADVPGCETDLRSDAENCGQCTRSCEGGDCREEVCLPLTIADELVGPDFVVVGNGQLYWVVTSPDGVMTAAADGSTDPAWLGGPLPPGGDEPTGLGWADGTVYVLNYPWVYQFDTTAGGPWQTVAADEGSSCCYFALAVGADRLYWSRVAEPRELLTAPRTGTGNTPELLAEHSTWVAADDTHVYWVSPQGIERMDQETHLDRSVVTHFDGDSVSALAVHGDYVYWMAGEHGLFQAPKEGGEPVPLTIEVGLVGGYVLSVDDSGLYWAIDVPGRVVRLAFGGSSPELLSRGYITLGNEVALDEHFIYFTTHNSVMRLVK